MTIATPIAPLAAEGLRLCYAGAAGPVVALDDVSLTIAAGEAVALVGRSGCGKTTLGRLLAGLAPAGAEIAGTLRWPGGMAPVAHARRAGLGNRVAWLPQEGSAALHPMLRVGTQIAETLRSAGHRRDTRAIATALAAVELAPDIAARYPHLLSGGQGQRVALACVLAQSPTILVADEPTSALDDATGDAILRLLDAQRRARGMSLVLVTHDLRAAAAHCERMLVLADGRIVEDGPRQAIMMMPRSAAARDLIAASRAVDGLRPCSARAA
jgi:ABC-type glutathione transport system ATPase component